MVNSNWSAPPRRTSPKWLKGAAAVCLGLGCGILLGVGVIHLRQPEVAPAAALPPTPAPRLNPTDSLPTAPAPAAVAPPPAANPAPTPAAPASQPASVGRGMVVCIDPGHPSDQADGCTAPDGTTETEINWRVGVFLRDELTKRGYQVVSTKSSMTEKVANRRRAEIANEAGAAMMIRLHCDSSPLRGFAVYYPQQEGHKDGASGPSPEVREASGRLARAIHAGLAAAFKDTLPDNGVKSDRATGIGAKQGALTGSIFSRVPTVTVEMVVLSNETEARWIEQPANQQRMAAALADGADRAAHGESR
jgi:N-acetylmuramoyl-L-alanine amidase